MNVKPEHLAKKKKSAGRVVDGRKSLVESLHNILLYGLLLRTKAEVF